MARIGNSIEDLTGQGEHVRLVAGQRIFLVVDAGRKAGLELGRGV